MEELISLVEDIALFVLDFVWEERLVLCIISLALGQGFIIRQYREMNKTLHDIVYQMVVDRNKDHRIDRIDDKAEWRK